MMNAVELKDMELDMVNGGNYGDKAKDVYRRPMYSYDTWVEVYNTPLHITTTRYKIMQGVKHADEDFWSYVVYDGNDDNPGKVKTVTANDIERK